MKKSARDCALEALLQVEENSGYSNIVIDKIIRKYELDKRDAALCSKIFYGVLEKSITLDYFLEKIYTRPDYKLNEGVKQILRIGAYQCLYLDKIPDSAIVNEAVNSVKAIKKQALGSFVNGVLRELIRKKDQMILPIGDSPVELSIRYSCTEELIILWINSYGKANTIKILESFLHEPDTYIRLNNTKLEKTEKYNKYQYLDYAYKYAQGGSITAEQDFVDGLFHVQDLSSQYLCEILDPQEGESIIDVCAAPGGKTFTIAEKMNGIGKVYSYDLYKGRVKLIREGAYRLGLKNVLASMRDATSEKCEISDADRILVDAPCSGFGTIRRKPEIRYKSVDEAMNLPEIQYDILCKSSKHLKQGGTLVYSTCTLNPAENGEIADRFLRENNDFEAVDLFIPKGLQKAILEPKNQLTMMPFAGETDGFFVSVFRKK